MLQKRNVEAITSSGDVVEVVDICGLYGVLRKVLLLCAPAKTIAACDRF